MIISLIYLVSLLNYNVDSDSIEKTQFCLDLNCDGELEVPVCGMKPEKDLFRIRIFTSECALLRHGCSVEEKEAFGITTLDHCKQLFPNYFNNLHPTRNDTSILINAGSLSSCTFHCNNSIDDREICGLRTDGNGFRIRIFSNKCNLNKHNCINKLNFQETDMYICGSIDGPNDKGKLIRDDDLKADYIRNEIAEPQNFETTTEVTNPTEFTTTTFEVPTERDIDGVEPFTIANVDDHTETFNGGISTDYSKIKKAVVILDNSVLNYNGDINVTMDNFFASTHVQDLPLINMQEEGVLNESSRRMLIKNLGGVVVFKPWVTKPENVSTDMYHLPTIDSCYHKCPMQCPDTYAPVCGTPGISAREPAVMFQNHCFMDVAQCKMKWEDKSSTSLSSTYIESQFIACLGDSLAALYRFLPLVRTLQHMGRIKKKGRFRYKIRNMGQINNNLGREPKLMG